MTDDDEELHPLSPAVSTRKVVKSSSDSYFHVPKNTTASLWDELLASTDVLFQGKLTFLLVLGPVAVLGDATGLLGKAACFAFAGIALIPCAERLSFITEQVAEHTNGTIGALLNATFGNAPELLISVAALRSGYYRVVQLAMLGSMMTNMIFVFGASCLIGGLRWQVQELRIASGNVNVVMLLVATAGSLFPAALVLTGQLENVSAGDGVPSEQEIVFSRVNAVVMLVLYACFLIFQLETHKDEFDDEPAQGRRARRNLFCLRHMGRARHVLGSSAGWEVVEENAVASAGKLRNSDRDGESSTKLHMSDIDGGAMEASFSDFSEVDEEEALLCGGSRDTRDPRSRRRRKKTRRVNSLSPIRRTHSPLPFGKHHKLKHSLELLPDADDDSHEHVHGSNQGTESLLSMRIGVTWLFIITLCVSAITDILVDTIDGFAHRMGVSEVFTSMVIIPFFSNVAEQVSAFIFAYRNEMDLCVGVTVGSAIQIATFVLPGSVLIGMFMDRSMTLFFRSYETVSLFFGVVMVGAVLQGGTTNWLVGAMLVGTYIIFASGIYFHEREDLTVDAEQFIGNMTRSRI